MLNFRYVNPVEVVFGKGTIASLSELIPADQTILMTYGGGSIKKNGVYEQVCNALSGRKLLEFGGIEPNPRYETCMKAIEIVKKENVDFLLAVGGGSVLDGTKFIAAGAKYDGDPWDILEKKAKTQAAVPLGCVITLPATGSEMNCLSVISKEATKQKLAFGSRLVFPKFAIMDPETNYSLPPRQVANGIVDTWIHVCEQYMTYPVNTPLQDRQAEAIFLTLLEEGPKVITHPKDYDVRANLIWAATWALNGWINCGVVQDWTTHAIGHELTALSGTDHARTLALVLPALWKHQRKEKAEKLLQYADRVFGIRGSDQDKVIDEAIAATQKFFSSVGLTPSRKEYGITDEMCKTVAKTLGSQGKIGERKNLGEKEIYEILQSTAE